MLEIIIINNKNIFIDMKKIFTYNDYDTILRFEYNNTNYFTKEINIMNFSFDKNKYLYNETTLYGKNISYINFDYICPNCIKKMIKLNYINYTRFYSSTYNITKYLYNIYSIYKYLFSLYPYYKSYNCNYIQIKKFNCMRYYKNIIYIVAAPI